MENDRSPVTGLFIPAEHVDVLITKRKRRSHFVCVYPKAVNTLDAYNLLTLLQLTMVADLRNRVTSRLDDLAKIMGLSSLRAVSKRLSVLRQKGAVIGSVPLLTLNPYFVSKCGATILNELRREWVLLQKEKVDCELDLEG